MWEEIMSKKRDTLPIYQIDAFTFTPFKGNPAAICLLAEEFSDAILQQIAAEMNLSETAFVYVKDFYSYKSESHFRLRWFTPKTEVKLCGHATLATAALLFYILKIEAEEVKFHTHSGDLGAIKYEGGVKLIFPMNAPKNIDPPMALLDAMGIRDFVNIAYSPNVDDLLIELSDENDVLAVSPNFEKMKEVVLDYEIRGVMVTARGTNGTDFVSRFFAPWYGINEDPVTGSAHTILTPYWAKKLEKTEMKALQVSERGGELLVRKLDNTLVEIIGNYALVLEGKIIL